LTAGTVEDTTSSYTDLPPAKERNPKQSPITKDSGANYYTIGYQENHIWENSETTFTTTMEIAIPHPDQEMKIADQTPHQKQNPKKTKENNKQSQAQKTKPTDRSATHLFLSNHYAKFPHYEKPAAQRSSIATFTTQQPSTTPANMATTTTTATTTVQPPVQTTTTGTTSAPVVTTDQRIRDRLRTAMRRNGGGTPPGGPPGGGPGGGGGGAGPVPTAAAQGPVPAAAPGDIRTMGTLPQIFTGNRAKAQDFLDEVLGYFRANRGVAGFESPMRKVSITLTMIKGSEVAGWAHDMGQWIDSLDPTVDDIELVWEQFQTEFTEQFTDSQQQQRARLDLDNCRMKFPEIDQYIAKFEDLA